MTFEVGAPAHAGQIVVDALERENVKRLYCTPGSHLMQFYDALRQTPSIQLVTCKQEPNTSLMADAYGRITGEPGVCLLTAGPGGANSLAGVAQAYGAASPVIHITGSVPLNADREAFHGVDDPEFLVDMFKKVTKWSVRVRRIEDVSEIMAKAFHIARSGRPGPVHIEIPRQTDYAPYLLQAEPIPLPEYKPQPSRIVAESNEDVNQIAQRLLDAQFPVICAGKGVIRKNATAELAEISEKFSIPVVYSQDSMGVIPYEHPFALGHYFASRNSPLIEETMAKCDLLLSVGLRADTAEVRHMKHFTPEDHILVSFDDGEDEHYKREDEIVADPKLFLQALAERLSSEAPPAREELKKQIADRKAELRQIVDAKADAHSATKPIHPGFLMKTLAGCLTPESIVVTDVGNCQVFARYYLPLWNPFSFMQSGVWNAMSFALPTAIVAKMEHPDRDVVGLVGDGALLMTFGDFVTACEHKANIVLIVLNDGAYGQMIGQQEKQYGAAYGCDFLSPDFSQMASACGALGVRVEEPGELEEAIQTALKASTPAIVEVMTKEYSYPTYS